MRKRLWAYADSEGPDQPAHSRRLIRTFTVRLLKIITKYSKVLDQTIYLYWLIWISTVCIYSENTFSHVAAPIIRKKQQFSREQNKHTKRNWTERNTASERSTANLAKWRQKKKNYAHPGKSRASTRFHGCSNPTPVPTLFQLHMVGRSA